MSFDVQHILLPIILLPILGALYNGIMGRRVDKSVVTAVAVGSVIGSFLLSLVGFGYLLSADEGVPPVLVHDVYDWFSITVGTQSPITVPIHVRFVMDHLSGIMTVMVTGIGALIHVYSTGYMEDDPGYARFMTYLNLFMASMLVLVLASNLPLMFVGWEGVGLCSYLLIGFWYTNKSYAQAGKKAFIVNRIGDFGVLIGMFILVAYVAPRSSDPFEFSSINAMANPAAGLGLGQAPFSFAGGTATFTVATIAGLFIFLGCTGKSAQIPLFVWLPDAMAGPTPVSALIHAATMVTAGVYLCCRLSPVLVTSPTCMAVIAIVGSLTALLAASIALVQNQMKKILAYSTVSQLGFMFAAVGMGAFAGGIFHVFTHAFFKACLFLGAGSVMHAVHAHGDADIRYLGGLRKKMPATHMTFLIATAAIAGLPPLAGFFSKDEILLGAATWFFESPDRWNGSIGWWENLKNGNWAGGWVGMFVFVVLSLAAAMTAFYMFRLYFRTFWGEYKGGHAPEAHGDHGDDAHAHGDDGHGHDDHWVEPHESPDSMTGPLWVLALGAGLVGLLGLPHLIPVHGINWWSSWMTPQHEEFLHSYEAALEGGAEHVAALNTGTQAARHVYSGVAALSFNGQMVHAPPIAAGLAMGVGFTVALLGFLLAFLWYQRADGEVPGRMMQSMPRLHRFLMDKWRVDELYEATIVSLMKWLGVVAANLDRFLVDMVLTKLTSWGMKALGFVVTRAQTGAVYAYAAMFVVGIAGLTWWFTYPHPMPEGEEARIGQIAWEVVPGLGTEFRWDYDSDGEWDTEWSAEASTTHDYANHRRSDPNDRSGAHFAALVGVFDTGADNFGPHEHVVEQGGGPVTLQFPNVIPSQFWAHPNAAPPDGWDRFLFELFGPEEPTLEMATVQRFDGELPEGSIPEAAEDGSRTVTLSFSIHPLAGEGEAPATWGPVEREVNVSADGRFSVLLGAEEELLISQIPQALEPQEDGSEVARMHGIVRFGDQSSEMDFEPQTGMLVHIHDAAIRDDDIDDGLLLLQPGASLPVGNGFTLTVAVQIRGTVEARNAFGNTTRSSQAVTLHVAERPQARAQARVEVGR